MIDGKTVGNIVVKKGKVVKLKFNTPQIEYDALDKFHSAIETQKTESKKDWIYYIENDIIEVEADRDEPLVEFEKDGEIKYVLVTYIVSKAE